MSDAKSINQKEESKLNRKLIIKKRLATTFLVTVFLYYFIFISFNYVFWIFY